MGFFQKVANGLGWLINPIGQIIDKFQPTAHNGHYDPSTGKFVYDATGTGTSPGRKLVDTVADKAQETWEDYTGQSQINEQLQANKELAKYQSDMQEEFYNKYSSPEALMRQYGAAGLNPALMYGSAGSGQGNVPSYTSPQAIRGLSIEDKMSKALGLISQLVGMRNLVYNSVALREAAEQAAIKTGKERESLSRLTLDNMLKYHIYGQQPSLGLRPFFKRSSLGRRKVYVDVDNSTVTDPFAQYANSVRTETLNRSVKAAYDNRYMYGAFYSPSGLFEYLPLDQARAYWLNEGTKAQSQQRKFNYDWDNEFKTMMKSLDVAGKLGYGIYRMLLGK